jgi:hypothetical protein
MKVVRKISVAVVVYLLATALHAQMCTISGKIIDSKTEEPLPQANVFINNSTIGAVSNLRGDFVLSNVRQPGTYELVISFIGYVSYKTKLSLSSNQLNIGTVHLVPSASELATLEVSASRDVEWEKKIKKFKKIFLGDDKAATQCVILNPWVIDFQNNVSNGRLVATAGSPIEIENKALGYKVNFYMSTFVAGNTEYLIKGNARFEFLKPADEKMLLQWEQNREISYYHSSQHLFKAIVDNRIKGEGFNLYTDILGFENSTTRSQFFKSELGSTVVVFDTTNMVTPMAQKDIYKITLKGRLEVHYRKEKAPSKIYYDIGYPISWITFTKPFILVNKEGVPINPSDIVISGAMGNDRVAQMLPLDYLPMGLLFKMREHEEYKQAMDSYYEKIYVHTDKGYYYPGETLWFKGYVNYSNPALRDSLSRTVYAELIHGPTKKVMLSKILPLDSGTFQGDFILTDSLKSSDCYLRTYTNVNRNYGDDKLYKKNIPVLNLSEKPEPAGAHEALPSESLKIVPNKISYHVHEKITLAIQVQDKDENPRAANLSISVTDASQVVSLPATSIVSDFPIYEIPEAKGFSWPVEYGIGFAAKIKYGKDKPMKEELNVIQMNPKNFFMIETDGQGVFSLTNLNFYDTSKFSFQAMKGKKQVFRDAELLRKEPPTFAYQPLPRPFKIAETPRQKSTFETPNDSRLLKEVDVNATKIGDPNKERPYGKADYVIKSSDINTSYGNLLLTISGRVPGLIVRRDPNGNWIVYVQRSATSSISNSREVTVLVNNGVMGGAPGDILGQIDPKTVESIEVTTSVNSVLGNLGCCGIVNIFTKSALSVNDEQKNISVLKIQGYTKPRKFTAPDYNIIKSDKMKVDDRSLLYWNPYVTTNRRSGTATASFFASDNEGQYKVIVEGVTEEGKPVHGECLIKVEH